MVLFNLSWIDPTVDAIVGTLLPTTFYLRLAMEVGLTSNYYSVTLIILLCPLLLYLSRWMVIPCARQLNARLAEIQEHYVAQRSTLKSCFRNYLYMKYEGTSSLIIELLPTVNPSLQTWSLHSLSLKPEALISFLPRFESVHF
jgi:hypothetical protein